jgi:hypothetical protein
MRARFVHEFNHFLIFFLFFFVIVVIRWAYVLRARAGQVFSAPSINTQARTQKFVLSLSLSLFPRMQQKLSRRLSLSVILRAHARNVSPAGGKSAIDKGSSVRT